MAPPPRPNGINLNSEEKKRWADLAKLDYRMARIPSEDTLDSFGIAESFRELCQRGQLTRLLLEPGHPPFQRLTLEFLSTLEVMQNRGGIQGIQFQLRNVRHEMDIQQFNDVFGITGEVIKEPSEFKNNANKFWQEITATEERFQASNAKNSQIRNPVLRMLQKACACHPFARAEHGSVHREELFLLWTILYQKPPLNLGHYMIKHLDRTAKKKTGFICVGKVISAIAHHLEVPTDDLVADIGDAMLDVTFLRRADFFKYGGPRRTLLIQRAKDHFPMPNSAFTDVHGPRQKQNWGMKTPAHRAWAETVEGAEESDQSPSSEEHESEGEEEEETATEQPESSSRAKRSRPPRQTSSSDHLREIAEGMSNLQMSQGQQDSRWEQMQQWHEEELRWRTSQEEMQRAQWAQIQQMQDYNTAMWNQQQQWNAAQDARWREQWEFMQAYNNRHQPPPTD